MDPADAGPSSKHDAGASPVSGDFPSDRADDSETSAESVDHRACASFDDVLPDLASMRASGLRGPRGGVVGRFYGHEGTRGARGVYSRPRVINRGGRRDRPTAGGFVRDDDRDDALLGRRLTGYDWPVQVLLRSSRRPRDFR